jgi:hypothetical protein
MNRVDRLEPIFEDDGRRRFLQTLGENLRENRLADTRLSSDVQSPQEERDGLPARALKWFGVAEPQALSGARR